MKRPATAPSRIRSKGGKERWLFLGRNERACLRETTQKPGLRQLRDRLVGLGGDFVVLHKVEDDLDAILARGRSWPGPAEIAVRGDPGRCHANLAALWDRPEHSGLTAIVTGYALTLDSDGIGCWRPHTWGLQRSTSGKRERLVETTSSRDAYFGVAMTARESSRFASEQFF